MPSNPAIYAWTQNEFNDPGSAAKWHVPSSFSCPSNQAVGRWLWKCSNSCNDANNIGRSTETFVREEYQDVVRAYNSEERILRTCASGVEMFISCFDFKVSSSASPTPSQPSPAPTTQAPSPAPTTLAPTQAPTQAPPTPTPAGPGLCCYGGCGGGNCQGGWCGESQGNCEGSCNGEFSPHAVAV